MMDKGYEEEGTLLEGVLAVHATGHLPCGYQPFTVAFVNVKIK
jgi:hypothetical protein